MAVMSLLCSEILKFFFYSLIMLKIILSLPKMLKKKMCDKYEFDYLMRIMDSSSTVLLE